MRNILISSPLESVLGLRLSPSHFVVGPVVLEFQLAFLGLMNQIRDLVLASLLPRWLISFFLKTRWKSQSLSFIYLPPLNIHHKTDTSAPVWTEISSFNAFYWEVLTLLKDLRGASSAVMFLVIHCLLPLSWSSPFISRNLISSLPRFCLPCSRRNWRNTKNIGI